MGAWLVWNMSALLTGYLLDLIFGDPQWFPHMVRGIGLLIRGLEKLIRPLCGARPAALLIGGGFLVALTVAASLGISLGALYGAGLISGWLRFAVAAFFAYQAIATRDLYKEGRAVCGKLEAQDIEGARAQLSRIVGRDTATLDEAGIVRATVETLAENLSDGVVAPLFYGLLFGVPGAVFYKAVNTLDSMVGYRNDRYLYFGRASARLDDLMNYIPARLSALLIVAASPLLGLSAGSAFTIWRRDGRNHLSPNSAQPEAAMAGALGIRLGGGNSYGGVWVEKPTIGDPVSQPEVGHIHVAGTLIWACSLLMASVGAMLMIILAGVVK